MDKVLEKGRLQPSHIGCIQLTDGSTFNYGLLRIESNELICYTGKGLREMFKKNMSIEEKALAQKLESIRNEKDGEQKLINTGHIAKISLKQIAKVLS